MSYLERLPAEGLRCLVVTTLAIEHREIVKCRCNRLVVRAQHSLSDLQSLMEDLGRLFQLALFSVAVRENTNLSVFDNSKYRHQYTD